MSREKGGVPEDQIDNITLEKADIEASYDLIREAFKDLPKEIEKLKQQIQKFLLTKAITVRGIPLDIAAREFFIELYSKALIPIEDKLNPEVFKKENEEIYGYRDRFDTWNYITGQDLTFSSSDDAKKIREETKIAREKYLNEITEALKDFKWDNC